MQTTTQDDGAGRAGVWTDDRTARLKTLWLDGFSASQVARQLGAGLTRNAVIGKIYRLGLKRDAASIPQVRRTRNPAPPRPRTKASPKPVGLAHPSRRNGRPPILEPELPLLEAADGPGLVQDILNLTPATCRWPIGDPRSSTFSFCGCSTADVYCERHKALAHRPLTAAMIRADRALARSVRTAGAPRPRPS